MNAQLRRRKERELDAQLRAAAGRLVATVGFVRTVGRVDAVDVARQLRMARQDVDLALALCGELDRRARAG